MECKEYVYKTCPDGTEIALDVYYEKTAESKNDHKPIAIYVHGGGWTVGSKSELPHYHIQRLVDLGFVPVSINYRLSPTIKAWDGAFADSKDAYAWCHTQLPKRLQADTDGRVKVDGDSIVIIGASAGGLLGAVVDQLVISPRAILDLYTVKSFKNPFYHKEGLPPSMAALQPPQFDESLTGQVYSQIPPPTSCSPAGPQGMNFADPRVAFLFDQAQKGTLLASACQDGNLDRLDPMTYINGPDGGSFPPTIVLHGTADDACPIQVSRDMVAILKQKGVEAELVEINGQGHGFDMMLDMLPTEAKKSCVDALEKGFAFLRKYV